MPTWRERLEEFEPYYPMKPRRRDATDEDFERLEAAMGGPLPVEYKEFVRECGGIAVEHAHVVVEDGGVRRDIEVFYGFGEPKYGFDLHGKLERFSDRLPKGMLPIGTDTHGNLSVLVVVGADAGTILFWEHDGPRDIETAPEWLRSRLDAEVTRRGRPGTAADLVERWNEIRGALPWWECFYLAAPSFDALISALHY
jgi:hypothetical protein